MGFHAFETYCAAVCVMVRWKAYHAPITYELTGHMEDHADYLMAKGVEPDEAAAHAVAAMGDPYALGKELDKLHSPWYPRLSSIFSLLSLGLVAVSIVLLLLQGGLPFDFAPFADPAGLLRGEVSDAALYEGRATGGGALGAYTFSGGSAVLYQSEYIDERDHPIYFLELVLPSTTPWLWLDSPDLSMLPHDENFYFATPLSTRGVFRRFTHLRIRVFPPLQSTYTVALGEGDPLSYTVRLEEVALP